MKAYCLASSSAGNCFVLEMEQEVGTTKIMIECGIPLPTIYDRLNLYSIRLSDISCCLITHAHKDHCLSAQKLDTVMPIFATIPTLTKIGIEGYELYDGKPNRVAKGMFVFPFTVEHDIDGAVGFVIKSEKETVMFINDHKRWTKNLVNFKPDYVFIECNYDHHVVYAQLGELERAINNNEYQGKELSIALQKVAQHKRNLNSHCSLNGTIKGLEKLNLSRCKSIFLMHLSDRYANEYKMKNDIQLKFGIQTFVCGKLGGIK